MPLCAWYMMLVLGISFAVMVYAASTPRPLRLGFSMPRARTRPRSHAWPNLPLQASWPGPPSPRPAPAPHSASTEPRERPLRLPRSVLSLNHAGSPIEAPGRPCCPLPLTNRATRPSSPPRASLATALKPQALGRAREPAAPALTHHACYSPAPSRSHPLRTHTAPPASGPAATPEPSRGASHGARVSPRPAQQQSRATRRCRGQPEPQRGAGPQGRRPAPQPAPRRSRTPPTDPLDGPSMHPPSARASPDLAKPGASRAGPPTSRVGSSRTSRAKPGQAGPSRAGHEPS